MTDEAAPPQRSVRIESNGHARGTHVYDVDTGAEIRGISKIRWWVEPGKMARCEITLVASVVKVVGELAQTEEVHGL